MFKKDPEGYRKLLVYQKSQALHAEVLDLVRLFPRTKTLLDLADQMSRSGRSTNKNIVGGWKRTTTQEYFDFLSFSVGSNSELKDDAADIVTGKYHELMGIKGIMGGRGVMGYQELDALKFYPLDETLPPAVKLYLKAKEINLLLYKLQQSLDVKMDKELTKPVSKKFKEQISQEKTADQEFEKYLTSIGLVRLPNGQYIQKDPSEM